MNISDKSLSEITHEYDGNTIVINKVFRIGPVNCPLVDDLFNTEINNIVNSEETICRDGLVRLCNGQQYKCTLHKEWYPGAIMDVSRLPINSDQRFLFITNIKCTKAGLVLIRIGRCSRIKIWINESLVFNEVVGRLQSGFLHVLLKQGNNMLFMEFETQQLPHLLQMRVEKRNDDLVGISGLLMRETVLNRVLNHLQIVKSKSYLKRHESFNFMIMTKDPVHIPSNTTIKIKILEDDKKLCTQFKTSINSPTTVDLSNYLEQLCNAKYITVLVSGKNIHGQNIETKFELLLDDIQETINKLNSRYEKICKMSILDEVDQINIQGRIENIQSLIKRSAIMHEIVDVNLNVIPLVPVILDLEKLIDVVENGGHFQPHQMA